MYNSGRRGKRTNDGYGVISTADNFNQSEYPIPTVTSFSVTDGSYNPLPDTAVNTAGGQTIVINGSGFRPGATVMVGGNTIGAVTYVDQGRLAFTAPALSSASYTIIVTNSNGGTGILVPGLVYSGLPTWSTGAGSIGSLYETKPISQSFVATGDAPLTYALYSGTLPSGSSLNSDGTLTGTAPVDSGSTTYSFTIRAYDAQNQHSDRSFSLTINTDVVTWSTPSNGQVITSYEYAPITNVTALATSAAGYGVLYTANATPTGITIDANTGLISGTANTVGNTFTSLTATANTTVRNATRDVIFNVSQDVVTWSSPADLTAYTLVGGSPMANITMSATSAAGRSIAYTANALPSGVGISGSVIYGTPTTAQTVTTLLTATTETTNRSATRTISWTVSLGDLYFKNVSLLLNGVTPTTTFINDASLNNTQLTIAGDTKPSLFSPYEGGYYSNYFDGNGDYLTTPTNAVFSPGTGDFTIEAWIYPTTASGSLNMIFAHYSSGISFYRNTGGKLELAQDGVAALATSTNNITVNVWSHVVACRSGTSLKLFINGSQEASVTNSTNLVGSGVVGIGASSNPASNYFVGNISNLRILKGIALYTTAFTPPASPLTAVSGTSLLTCQSNRFIDNSNNNLVITKNGDVTVSSAVPFVTPTTSSYNTQYSTSFDGTGDYLNTTTTGQSFGTGDFTIEGWVYNTGSVSNSGIFQLNSSAFGGLSGIALAFYSAGSGITTYHGAGSQTSGTVSLTTNTWYHFALVRISGSLKVYFNGILISTIADTTNYNLTTFTLGGYYSSSYLLTGNISNFRVVKGVGVYTGAFTPPTSPLTLTQSAGTNISAITSGQTILLTCQNSTLIDNSSNAFTITSTGDAKPIAVSPFTMTTSSTTVTSLGSAYFDGTGDYLQGTSNPAFTFGTGAFTIEAWINPTVNGPTTGNWIYSNISTGSGNSEIGFIRMNDGTIRLTTWNTSIVASTLTAALNVWTHVVGSFDGTTYRLFVNGVLSGTSTNVQTLSGTGGPYIGTAGVAGVSLFTGYISDLRVIKGTALYIANFLPPQAPLTPVVNTQLLTCQYNGGGNNNGFVDQSSFNNIVTRSGNATQGTFSPYSQTGWSTYYNGSNSYQYVPTNTAFAIGTADFTVEAWVYPTTSNQQYSVIFAGISYGSSSDWGLYLNESTISSAMKPSFLFANGGSAFSSGTTVSVGAWTHIAVARQGTTVRFFINGALTATTTSNASLLNSIQKGIGGGFNGNGSTLLTGYISNLRVVSGTAVYTSAFTPPTSPLTPIAGTILLTNQNNRWIDNSPNNFAITTGGTPTAQAYSPFGGVTSVPTSYSNYFDGSGDYLSTPSNAAFTLDGNFTVEAWVYLTAGGVSSGIISTYLPNTTYGVGLLLNTSNQLVFKIGNDASAGSNFIVTDATALQLNTWYHVAGVRSGNTMTLYKNGTSVGSTGSVTYTPATTTAVIGRYYTNTDNFYFIGYISNSRIVKGQALYTSNFTPSTTPLTTTSQGATASNVSLLTCQSATIVDNSTNYFALTAAGNTQPYTFNPFGLTNTTGVSYTPAVNGGSMYFDGTGDYLSVTNNTAWSSLPGDFTIECWFYFINSTQQQQVLFTQRSSSNQYVPYLFWTNNATIVMYSSSNNGSWDIINGNTVVSSWTPQTWNHFAFTRSGSTNRIFLNGVQTYTYTNSSSFANSGTFQLGMSPGETNTATYGYVTDARLLKTAIYTSNFVPPVAPATPTQTIGASTYASTLLLNGTSGGIIDYHSTNNLETVGNTQLAPQDPYSGSYYSNYFTGSSDYLQTPSNAVFAFSGAFTVEGWFYWPAIPSAGTLCGPLTGGAFNFYTDGNYLSFNIFGVGNVCVVSSFPSRNTWHHIAMTRDASNNCTIWVDGVSSATGTSAHSFVQGAWTIYGGSNNGGSGWVSNFRVVKGQALYTSNFTPSTSPLTAVSGTSLLTCQSNTFKDNSTNNFTITRNGDTKVQSFNPFRQNTGKSLYFGTKTDTYAMRSIPSIANLPGDFTIECWVNPTDTSISTTWGILDARSAGASASAWLICLSSYSSGWVMNMYTGTSYSGTTRVQANQWTHCAWVRSGSTLTFYVNGVAGGTATVAGAITGGTTTVVLGSKDNNLSGYGTVGYIKDLRITQGVARYTANFTPPTSLLEVK